MNKIFINLLLSLGCLGLFAYALGLVGFFKPIAIVPLTLPCFWFGIKLIRSLTPQVTTLTRLEQGLIGILVVQFLIYSFGLLVPETGFDALWYHLPEAQVYAHTGKIAPISGLLYSTMPRLGEMYFAIAFLFSHSLVEVKLVSFIFAILLSLVSYLLSRLYLTRPKALLVTIVVNSLYLVSWQATSAYVDLPLAVFELASLYCLMSVTPKSLILSGLFTGLALSVKFQAVIHLVASLFILVFVMRNIRHTAYFILITLLVALPWYLDNFLTSGHPLYPTNLPSLELSALHYAGAASLPGWLIHQVTHLPLLFWDLTLHPRDYLTPLILILLPVLVLQFRQVAKHSAPLVLYMLISLVCWWFAPPPETRYLLGALPPLILLELWAVFSLPRHQSGIKNWSLVFVFLSIGLNLFLRLASSYKYVPVILGQITPSDYITAQTNDFNRPIVTKFYSNYWLNYRY